MNSNQNNPVYRYPNVPPVIQSTQSGVADRNGVSQSQNHVKLLNSSVVNMPNTPSHFIPTTSDQNSDIKSVRDASVLWLIVSYDNDGSSVSTIINGSLVMNKDTLQSGGTARFVAHGRQVTGQIRSISGKNH